MLRQEKEVLRLVCALHPVTAGEGDDEDASCLYQAHPPPRSFCSKREVNRADPLAIEQADTYHYIGGSYGATSKLLTVEHYQKLIDRGWRRYVQLSFAAQRPQPPIGFCSAQGLKN